MKEHRPRRGSMAYSPRKRASSIVPRIRAWPELSEAKVLGFAGYKAGMTHVVMVDDRRNSPTYGEEIVVPVTVIESPPLKVAGVRAYRKTPYGLQIAHEVWAEDLDRNLGRLINLPESIETSLEDIDLDGVDHFRLLTHTQPYVVSGVPKKVPELMEQKVGGSVEEAFEYVKEKLGKEIRVFEAFEEGSIVDVISITKGKGFQGPVKRWGVITLNAKHARSSKHRRIGNLGPWNPHHVRHTVPQAGQTGFHQRTEFNKRIVKMGDNGEEITPNGGFVHYGVVRGDYVLVSGSVPGPVKRLIRFRHAIRPPSAVYEGVNVVYVSTSSKQGR